MEQYRNCNRNGGRYPAQPNLMMQYANNRNASSCNGNRQGTGGCSSRQDHCETTRKDVETCGRFSPHLVGMAYVPSQEFGELYDAKKGLCEGTMFLDLNLIFCGVRGK